MRAPRSFLAIPVSEPLRNRPLLRSVLGAGLAQLVSKVNYFRTQPMTSDSETSARAVLETLPLVLRVIRAEIRRSRFPDFSLPQFRALAFLGRNRGAMLTDVADHLGLSLPAASKLVDGLVSGKMVSRKSDPADRRRMILVLTAIGEKKYGIALDSAVQMLASKVVALSAQENAQVVEAMRLLRSVFADCPKPDSSPKRNGKSANLRTAASAS